MLMVSSRRGVCICRIHSSRIEPKTIEIDPFRQGNLLSSSLQACLTNPLLIVVSRLMRIPSQPLDRPLILPTSSSAPLFPLGPRPRSKIERHKSLCGDSQLALKLIHQSDISLLGTLLRSSRIDLLLPGVVFGFALFSSPSISTFFIFPILMT